MSTVIRLTLVSLLIAPALVAQNNRSAVSVAGSDANLCTTTAPCRSFGVALSHTNPGGEVIAFDSGGYGPFTITHSVSVIGAPGVHAALTVGSGIGIEVAAGAADAVLIRNLNITVTDSSASGGTGIYATGFVLLTVESCMVNGGHNGIMIVGSVNSRATISDMTVRQIGSIGYYLQSRVAIVRSRAENCGDVGLYVQNGPADASVSAVDFVSVGNVFGAAVYSTGASYLQLDRAMISNNDIDGITVYSDPGTLGHLNIANSTVTNNGGFGLSRTGSSVIGSMRNNLVVDNGTNINGTINTLPAY
jgi:hypothetical protein